MGSETVAAVVVSPALRLVPVTQAQAKRFVAQYHRHNVPSIASVFQVGVAEGGVLVGVAVCGLPKARVLMDGRTLEVTRVCTVGTRNACSMLYAACARAAKALGYARLVTYTLATESGSSLRACGFQADTVQRNHDVDGWHGHPLASGKPFRDLFGVERIPSGPKVRWWLVL